jgi:Raf kinase inhibitor-like YbhB/YbcL family protein
MKIFPRSLPLKPPVRIYKMARRSHYRIPGGIFAPHGQDIAPQLSWRGFPEGTKSFVVTMYDPDAPTPSGFWHWAVVDIPVSVTQLARGAGKANSTNLPAGAFQLPNDGRLAQYVGAAPPAGHGKHHYYIVVTAVDVESLGLNKDATPAFLSFNLLAHTLGRAMMVPGMKRSFHRRKVAERLSSPK